MNNTDNSLITKAIEEKNQKFIEWKITQIRYLLEEVDSLENTIQECRNKIDKIENMKTMPNNRLGVSCVSGTY